MQNLKKILKNKKGFTLVELMVVVAILGILVAVAVPVYSNVTDNAKKKTCESNIATIKSAVAVYQAGNNGNPPETLQDLVDADVNGNTYLEKIPACPYHTDDCDATADYTYTDGEVECACDGHDSDSDDDNTEINPGT